MLHLLNLEIVLGLQFAICFTNGSSEECMDWITALLDRENRVLINRQKFVFISSRNFFGIFYDKLHGDIFLFS